VVRILPAYWVALTLWLALVVIAGTDAQVAGPAADWWRYYGLTQIYQPATEFTGLGVAWSLCVEVTFYALLPVLAGVVARLAERTRERPYARGLQPAVIAVVAALSIDVRLSLAPSLLDPVPDAHVVVATSLLGLFDWFAIGMVLAVAVACWERRERGFGVLERLARRPGACWLGALVLFGVATPIQGGDMFLPADSAAAHLLIGAAAGLLVLPAVSPAAAHGRRRLLGVLGSPPVAWLGTISYGIYLFHVPALVIARAVLEGRPLDATPAPLGTIATAGLLLATVCGAIALGAASWYLIERPAQRRWGRGVQGSGRKRPDRPGHAQLEGSIGR
jgi:peptidoglycan/LPS O-acetylase OafA/YrhL